MTIGLDLIKLRHDFVESEKANKEATKGLVEACERMVSTMKWAEKTVPGTNFQGDILFAEYKIEEAAKSPQSESPKSGEAG